MNQSITDVLTRLMSLQSEIFELMAVVAYGLGAWMSWMTLSELRESIEERGRGQATLKTAGFTALAGVLFFAFPSTLEMGSVSVFGEQASIISGTTGSGTGANLKQAYVIPVLMLIQLIGAIAVMKSILTLRDLGKVSRPQEATFGRFMFFFWGGVLSWNIYFTLSCVKWLAPFLVFDFLPT